METLKRFGAIIIALVMMCTLSVIAFAGEAIPENGVILQTSATSITIKKEITAYNPIGSDINAPSITYSYTIAPGSAGKTIKDANSISATTVAGLSGATITESISWDAEEDQMHTASHGVANYKTITVNLTNVDFPAAGVYRYVINETATYTNTGVVDEEDHTRYLDVYVKNSQTEDEFEIYGYVLFTYDNSIDGTSDATGEPSVGAAQKTEGFVGDKADKYYTYNLTIGKTLNSDDGMINHQFPFGITFIGSEDGVLPIIEGSTSGITIPAWTEKGEMSDFNTNATTNGTLKIASGKSVTIKGIPVGTSVEIQELNDVTGTTYAAASSGADINAESTDIGTGETSGTAIIEAQSAGDEVEDKTVNFLNSLKTISPTGLVMRFAPYALILAGGVALLVIALKRKSRKDDDD